jgi:protein arginine kinase activator
LHIIELMQGTPHEIHLCEECARQYLSGPEGAGGGEPPAQGTGEATSEGDLEELDKLVCPNCGITFKEFRSQGRLGCPHDYVAFQEELMPLLENIHGETQHAGKVPRRAPADSRKQYDLIRLRNELRQAVAEESYERAARLRDEIHALEQGRTGGPEPT